jgi:hypothetical protein
MKIPADAIIPPSKLTDYLLSPRPWDDKSKFLGQAGFTQNNPEMLENAIRRLVKDEEAVNDGINSYGTFFRVQGSLKGPTGHLAVVLIWLQWKVDGMCHFVTLKPGREKS